jgi:hypothetical protein
MSQTTLRVEQAVFSKTVVTTYQVRKIINQNTTIKNYYSASNVQKLSFDMDMSYARMVLV